jgi:hypothetical protein
MALGPLTDPIRARIEVEIWQHTATAKLVIGEAGGGGVTVASINGPWASVYEALVSALEGAAFGAREAAARAGSPIRHTELIDMRDSGVAKGGKPS